MHLLLALLTIVGTWQGTINGPNGPARRVMEITQSGGKYHVAIHSIDETDVPIVTDNVTVNGAAVAMKFDMNTDPWMDYHRTYDATLSADGSALSGSWGGPGLPSTIVTNYKRVAKATWPVVVPKIRMVTVDSNVKDEVLDWGGQGRAVVLLAGAGNTGHDFLKIVPALTARYHVYSMTRRGFGASSKPAFVVANYTAKRLADDVVAVLDQLKIEKPVLIGHSLGGEELSSIGMRYPGKVSALVYLDAGYWYAFDPGTPNPMAGGSPPPNAPPEPPLLEGMQSFKGPINVPILAIYAHPHEKAMYEGMDDAAIAKREAQDDAQINAFQKGLHATVIRIPNASHFVYMSNTEEVLRDINAFIATLSKN